VTELQISNEIRTNAPFPEWGFPLHYGPGSDEELATVGAGIGSNTHLKKLDFDCMPDIGRNV
jgi:hypothetical protein